MPRYQVCTKLVMDTSDPDISFDDDGVCSWWHDFHKIKSLQPQAAERVKLLEHTLKRIKGAGRDKQYDCLLGLSGGVDSSYLAVLAKEWGLRPLVLHFDNGWNDQLAVANIETMVKSLNFRLETFVMNWPEFRDLQRSYFKASVLDLDVPTDHMIFGALHQIANKYDIKYILSGNNFATEWLLPSAWYGPKFDLLNLLAIHHKFGEIPLKTLPKLGVWQQLYYRRIKSIEDVKILDLYPYSRSAAKKRLVNEFGWKDYGGKHHEQVFTRFYQGYILPKRYGIDKRKAHLSNLILNHEITRDQALAELQQSPYDPKRQEADHVYVAKKLGWSSSELENLINLPPVPHEHYGCDAGQRRRAERTINMLQPLAKPVRRVLRFQR
jgi:N-acetyl sugar amidotransferase